MYAVLTVKVFIIKNCPLRQVSTDSLQHFSAEGRGSHILRGWGQPLQTVCESHRKMKRETKPTHLFPAWCHCK